MATPAEILRQQLPDIESVSDAPRKFKAWDWLIKKVLLSKVAALGIPFSSEQKKRLVVEDGYISSPDLEKIETLLGLKPDGIMDRQLEKALDNEAVVAALKPKFSSAALPVLAQGHVTQADMLTPAAVPQPAAPPQRHS